MSAFAVQTRAGPDVPGTQVRLRADVPRATHRGEDTRTRSDLTKTVLAAACALPLIAGPALAQLSGSDGSGTGSSTGTTGTNPGGGGGTLGRNTGASGIGGPGTGGAGAMGNTGTTGGGTGGGGTGGRGGSR
jgi:hypothetical protein